MNKKLLIILAVSISGALLFSCSKSIEKKIAGTWKVEDVKFDSGRPIDPSQLEASKESAKTVRYELLEDKTAKILVGTTSLEGTWTFKEAESGVYMAFKGSFDTVLLGRYEEDKLINEATRPDLKITTIFIKEK